MTVPTLHYVHDPLCGWCYAAAPMVEAVANAGIPIVLHGGGLWQPATGLDPEKRAYIRQSDARVAAASGVAFCGAYLDGLLMDTDTVFWSPPTIAAVLAAGAIEPGAELRMMHAVQRAHYVAGRRVVDPSVLAEVAGSIALNVDAFRQAIKAVAVDVHIAATRRRMQETGLRGFPGFLLEHGAELTHVQHESFYGRPDSFLHAIEVLATASPAA